MRKVAVVPLAALAAAMSLVAAPVQQPTFRGGVQTVAVYATVRDASGRLAPDLTRDDFEILDNGKPVPITSFSSDPQPITAALLLDLNWATELRLLLLKESTLRFVDSLLPGDRLRLGTFGVEVALSPLLTGHQPDLARVVREELWADEANRESPFWGAIDVAMTSLAGEPGRRVVLALTGRRGCSTAVVGQVVGFGARVSRLLPQDCDQSHFVKARAVREDFMIYVVGLEGLAKALPDHSKTNVTGLAEDTGGGHMMLADDADLATAFTRIAEELRHQYVLGFTPAAIDRREHQLDVRVRRTGYTARGRRTYVADETVVSTAQRPLVSQTPVRANPARTRSVPSAANLSAFVTLPDGSPVVGLAKDEFTVSIDGRQRPIDRLTAGADSSFSLVILADLSLSLQAGPVTVKQRDALRGHGAQRGLTEPGLALSTFHIRSFVTQAFANLRRNDRVRIGTVERTPTLSNEWLSAPRALNDLARRALRMTDYDFSRPILETHPLSSPQRGPSPIWDAVDMAVEALAGERGHRAILLLTDGHATGNRLSLTDVGQRAMLAGVSIHVVGARDAPYLIPQLGTTAARVDPRTNLQWLAEITGGSFASMAEEINPTAQAMRVLRELHSTYVLDISGFPAPTAGTIAPIDVQVSRPGVTVRTPKGYGGMGQ